MVIRMRHLDIYDWLFIGMIMFGIVGEITLIYDTPGDTYRMLIGAGILFLAGYFLVFGREQARRYFEPDNELLKVPEKV